MKPTGRGGFLLIEIMIAIVILGFVMTTLLGSQGSAVSTGSRANSMTIAAMLARAKMLDIESEVNADGFEDDTMTEDGNFSDEGYPEIKWDVEIELVEIDEGASETLIGETNGKLFGEGEDGSGGAFTGNAAFAAYLPMVVGMVPDMINRLGKKTRKVTLNVTWEFKGYAQKLELVQYITDLKADDRNKEVALPGLDGGLPGGVK